jgi:predicted HTH domain antitoxin
MTLKNSIRTFLGAVSEEELIKSKKEVEQLSKEKYDTEQKLHEIQKNVEQLSTVKKSDEVYMEQLAEFLKSQQKTNPSEIAKDEKLLDTTMGISGVKQPPKELLTLYLTNQFVYRAINIRADELVARGYKLIEGDEKGIALCQQLINDSGDSELFWQLSVNTDFAGDGFLEKIWSKDNTHLLELKHIHPVTFGFKRDIRTDKIILNKDKEPIAYEQKTLDAENKEQRLEVSKDKIAHFMYQRIGDEFTGLSIIQPCYNTLIRLMNMEESAAAAAVKISSPLLVGKTNAKSPNILRMWAMALGRISGKEQVLLPEGFELDQLSPGNQTFSEYTPYFVDVIVANFGVPPEFLLGTNSSGRAEALVKARIFYQMIRRNQNLMARFFNKIFEEYGEKANFKPPKLVFEDTAEDAEYLYKSAIELYKEGLISREQAQRMIGLEATQFKNETYKNSEKPIENKINESDMKTLHPAKPGSPDGSQKGNKKEMRKDRTSLFKG